MLQGWGKIWRMVWLVPASGWPRGGMQEKQWKPTAHSICQEPGGSHFFSTESLNLHFSPLGTIIIPILHMRRLRHREVICPRLHGLKQEELGFEPGLQSPSFPKAAYSLTLEQEGWGPGGSSPWRHRF